MHPDKCPESELLELAALTESYSTHPISRSILEAYGHEPDRSRVTHVEEVAGHGVKAVVDICSSTSAIAGWSAVALLRNLASPVCFF